MNKWGTHLLAALVAALTFSLTPIASAEGGEKLAKSHFYEDDGFYNAFPYAEWMGGDWYYDSVYGYLNTASGPWVWFDDLGSYLYVDPYSSWGGELNLWDPYTGGWLWTSDYDFPWVYDYDFGVWYEIW